VGFIGTSRGVSKADDEAACLLCGANTCTNFVGPPPAVSLLTSRIRALLNHKKKLNKRSMVVERPVFTAAACARA
jgi:EREBP-like factor